MKKDGSIVVQNALPPFLFNFKDQIKSSRLLFFNAVSILKGR